MNEHHTKIDWWSSCWSDSSFCFKGRQCKCIVETSGRVALSWRENTSTKSTSWARATSHLDQERILLLGCKGPLSFCHHLLAYFINMYRFIFRCTICINDILISTLKLKNKYFCILYPFLPICFVIFSSCWNKIEIDCMSVLF